MSKKLKPCGDCSVYENWLSNCQEADYMTSQGNYHAYPDNPCDKCAVKLRQRIAELGDALRAGYDAMNYLGDILNNMDVVTDAGEKYVTPLFDKVRAALGYPDDPPSKTPIWHGPEEVPEKDEMVAVLASRKVMHCGFCKPLSTTDAIDIYWWVEFNGNGRSVRVKKWAYVRDLEALE